MDNPYNQGYIPPYPPQNQHAPTLASFGNLSGPGHQQEPQSHQTLPPLQNQNGGYHFGSLSYTQPGSQSHTPTTPHTPVTSSVQNNNGGAYSHMSPVSQQPGGMLPPSYNQHYGIAQQMQGDTGRPTSMPPTPSTNGLPAIRPMPTNGLPSMTSGGQLAQQSSFMQNEETPTHVVGSQGRRGILPSAPGRQPPVSGTTQSTKSMIPQKDADGKFPCPHCNKTYLHAKHLKRHLLRHTGDRPYMCHLCKDTFSRSDILKRHFQKCSIRRGNPTGANHLAHQRRNTNSSNRLSMSQQDGPIGLAGLQEVTGNAYNPGINSSPTVNGDISTRSSRANSIITPANIGHRNSIAGLGILSSNGASGERMAGLGAFAQQGVPPYNLPNASSSVQMPPNYAFNHQHMNGNIYNNPQQQMAFLGQQSSRFDNSHSNSPHQAMPNGDGQGSQFDWHRMFNQGGQDGFMGSQPANASSQDMKYIKPDPDIKDNFGMHNDMSNESFLGNLYSHPGALGEYGGNQEGTTGCQNWSAEDPLRTKAESLLQYCLSDDSNLMADDPNVQLVQSCLTVDAMRHFAEHYTSWHGHWPMVHMPTFDLASANNSLVLAMLCIGAVYSPRLDVIETRQLMDFVKTTILRKCSIYKYVTSGQVQVPETSNGEVEELQALLLVLAMHTWHGEPHQRQAARDEFPAVVRIAKAMGLCRVSRPGHYAFSVLHSGPSNNNNPQLDAQGWNWHTWLEQEKRNRALYILFLTDAASVMYFNTTPQFDPLDIRLPLPADDAAWDAKDAQACASALGLFGSDAQHKNLTGTRRPKQPGMREALRTLLEPTTTFQPCATNAYAKFILIHALIVRIVACQKALLQSEGPPQGFNLYTNGSTPATPLSQNDWLEHRPSSASLSADSSGHATPTDGTSHPVQSTAAQQEKKRLGYALDKWYAIIKSKHKVSH